jgi:TadE-like protein
MKKSNVQQFRSIFGRCRFQLMHYDTTRHSTSTKQSGSGSVELLMALPIVLMLGLGALQAGLLLSAKLAINYAAQEAGRAGSVGHADRSAIEQGLARGLVPWLYGASDYGDFLVKQVRAQAFVTQGQGEGWLTVQQLSPTQASFDDWAVAAVDADGEPVPDVLEIPNDNLHIYKEIRAAKSGASRNRGSEPIGSSSGQTLLDANTLKLNFVVGVPASVPIVGPMLVWTLRVFHGCEATSARRVGLVHLGSPEVLPSPNAALCNVLTGGSTGPKLPIRAEVTIGMQTAARTSGLVVAKAQTAQEVASLGGGTVESAAVLKPPAQLNLEGRGVGTTVTGRPNGYSQIGGSEPYVPGEGGSLPGGACPGG